MTADPGGSGAAGYRNSVAERPHRAWTVVLPQHTRAAAVARRSTGEVLRAWELDHLEPVALLVVSELVTNAVLHAYTGGSSPELHLHAGSTWLRIEVHDADPRPPQPRTPAGLDEAGRGLLLIEAITAEWGVYVTATGKAVWAILQLSR
jgi:anti-sigma regulatory factor (Ser/Thr protein kinase)